MFFSVVTRRPCYFRTFPTTHHRVPVPSSVCRDTPSSSTSTLSDRWESNPSEGSFVKGRPTDGFSLRSSTKSRNSLFLYVFTIVYVIEEWTGTSPPGVVRKRVVKKPGSLTPSLSTPVSHHLSSRVRERTRRFVREDNPEG